MTFKVYFRLSFYYPEHYRRSMEVYLDPSPSCADARARFSVLDGHLGGPPETTRLPGAKAGPLSLIHGHLVTWLHQPLTISMQIRSPADVPALLFILSPIATAASATKLTLSLNPDRRD